MKKEHITLKDIADAMGVSTITVHRALRGKDQVSAATREKALQIAAEMGYRSNYMAASLKRKALRFVFVFPELTMENRYYYMGLWNGAHRFLERVEEFNIEGQDFFYPLAHGNHGALLKEIYEKHLDELDGLVTIAVNHSQSSYFIEKLAGKGIPIVLIGAEMCRDASLCCVKSYDGVAGRLAAELLTTFRDNNTPQKMIIISNLIGRFTMLDQLGNSRGFEEYINQKAPDTTLLTVYDSDNNKVYDQVRSLLRQNPDTDAIYACSARRTIQMCRAVVDSGMAGKIRLIGNDCFEESSVFLRQGVLTAIIDKKIMQQGYLATQALFNYVVKTEYPASSILQVRPSIVMQSNLDEEMIFE